MMQAFGFRVTLYEDGTLVLERDAKPFPSAYAYEPTEQRLKYQYDPVGHLVNMIYDKGDRQITTLPNYRV